MDCKNLELGPGVCLAHFQLDASVGLVPPNGFADEVGSGRRQQVGRNGEKLATRSRRGDSWYMKPLMFGVGDREGIEVGGNVFGPIRDRRLVVNLKDRKSTRLNSSHVK